MGLTELTVASWNVNRWHTIRDAQLDLIDELGPTLLLLQEVTPASMSRLTDRGWRGTTTLQLLPESHIERGCARPRFACAVAVRGPRLTLEAPTSVPNVPSAVRSLR